MSRRPAPRPVAGAVGELLARVQPQSTLGEIQRVWEQAVGATIAAEATPTAESGGVLTVSCRSSAWASDLDLLGPELLAQLDEVLGAGRVTRLRCIATTARSWSRER